ncbi:MAG: 30S ribosomal protein S20 [Patescibacteria group bacterium]
MPIKESAKKELRKGLKRRSFNLRRQKTMKEMIKKIKKLVQAGQKDEAKKLVALAYQAIDKAAKNGLIKRNNAARKKSQVMRLTAK